MHLKCCTRNVALEGLHSNFHMPGGNQLRPTQTTDHNFWSNFAVFMQTRCSTFQARDTKLVDNEFPKKTPFLMCALRSLDRKSTNDDFCRCTVWEFGVCSVSVSGSSYACAKGVVKRMHLPNYSHSRLICRLCVPVMILLDVWRSVLPLFGCEFGPPTRRLSCRGDAVCALVEARNWLVVLEHRHPLWARMCSHTPASRRFRFYDHNFVFRNGAQACDLLQFLLTHQSSCTRWMENVCNEKSTRNDHTGHGSTNAQTCTAAHLGGCFTRLLGAQSGLVFLGQVVVTRVGGCCQFELRSCGGRRKAHWLQTLVFARQFVDRKQLSSRFN